MLRLAIAASIALLWAAPAAAERRIALVIGNDAYVEVPSLAKAVNDANGVAAALSAIGFEATIVENATRNDMSRGLNDFERRIEPGDTAFFFFAGHGFEIRGESFLLPTDVPPAREGEESLIADASFSDAEIGERIQSRGARTVIMVLDACRDNPFARPGETRALFGTRGLARMDPAEGMFVLFSAGAKQQALDGLDEADPEANSVFTRVFIEALNDPGLSLVQLAKQTQTEVRALAESVGHTQTPAYYDQIVGDFYLTPPDAESSSPAPAQEEEVANLEQPPVDNITRGIPIVPFDLYYSVDRGDNFTTATAIGGSHALAAGYFLARTEGYVYSEPVTGTVPLRLYWDPVRADNFTAATAEAERDAFAAGYAYARVEGYLYPNETPGTKPLKLYYGDERGEYFVTATPEGESSALAAGYRFVRIEGYVLAAPF